MSSAGSVISAFTEDQVESLTGVTKRQLRYWDRTTFFVPTFAAENRRDAYSRIYSFKDITALRVLNVLRNQYSVPLQHLRQVAQQLSHLSDAKWTAVKLYVLNKRVIFVEPDTEQYREIVSKQYVVGIALSVIIEDTQRDIKKLQSREADKIGKITKLRSINHNSLVIAGTRIPIKTIKRFAEDGYSIQQIQKEYPTLTEADIQAALRHGNSGVAA